MSSQKSAFPSTINPRIFFLFFFFVVCLFVKDENVEEEFADASKTPLWRVERTFPTEELGKSKHEVMI